VTTSPIPASGGGAAAAAAGPFEILARDGEARLSRFVVGGRVVDLPAFMPVGTAAAVKALTPAEVRSAGFGLILANTYHLMLRPGVDVVERAGGDRKSVV
jgi:queuine tRNA-ribosyltransferase